MCFLTTEPRWTYAGQLCSIWSSNFSTWVRRIKCPPECQVLNLDRDIISLLVSFHLVHDSALSTVAGGYCYKSLLRFSIEWHWLPINAGEVDQSLTRALPQDHGAVGLCCTRAPGKKKKWCAWANMPLRSVTLTYGGGMQAAWCFIMLALFPFNVPEPSNLSKKCSPLVISSF